MTLYEAVRDLCCELREYEIDAGSGLAHRLRVVEDLLGAIGVPVLGEVRDGKIEWRKMTQVKA